MSSVKASLTTANVVTVNSQPQTTTGQKSTGTGPANPNPPPVVAGCTDPDPFGYMKVAQEFQLNENFGTTKVPFGKVTFSAFSSTPWGATIPARQYTVDNVIGTDDNERNVVYNQVNIKEGDQTYTVPITSSTTKQIYPAAQFSFWNPRLLMGVDVGANVNHAKPEIEPSINLGIMSFGRHKTTPDLSILEVGAAYQGVNQKPALVVTPVAYNFGKNWFSPLMNNSYLAPSVAIAPDGSWTIGGGIRVGF
jgi:hypothetical protein